MKRITALSLSLALALLLLAGCGRACNSENASSAEGAASSGGNAVSSAVASPSSAAGSGDEITGGQEEPPRMVMVDGVLYADTGRPSSVTARCGTMDGEITSTVEAGQVPSQDNQSNFGADYGYQFGFEEGTIEVYIGQEWVVFAPAE